ncbi:MAG: CPBP family intramembrane metalloprotease [Ignavibacteria bacterium]|nr:CPBP family intramembrane metalloprotease [Ignavibacteria bacterium]
MTEHVDRTPDGRPLPQQEPSFLQRYNISPAAFALICLFLIFLLYQVVGGTLTFFLIGTRVTPENVMQHRTLTIVGQTLFILLPTLLFARLLSRKASAVFPWRMPRVGETIFASLGLIFLQEVFQIYLFFQDRIPLPEDIQRLVEPLKEMIQEMFKTLVSSQTVPELLFVILVVAVAPAVIEELLFRGLIQSSFERVITPARAALITGIIFGAFHFNPFAIIPLMILGWYFGYLRMRSKSIVLAMTVHFLNNVLAVVVAYFRMDDQMVLGATEGSDINMPMILAQLFLFLALFTVSFSSYLRVTSSVQAGGEE